MGARACCARDAQRSLSRRPPPFPALFLAPTRNLLGRIQAATVSRNRAEKSINSILELVSSLGAGAGAPAGAPAGAATLRAFYAATLSVLTGAGGGASMDRLAFKTRLKLARSCLASRAWGDLRAVLDELSGGGGGGGTATGSGDGGGAPGGDSSAALEVLALRLQMAAELDDKPALASLVAQAQAVRGAVPAPAVSGVIHESAGKLLMGDREWGKARGEFLEAFKAFNEAGAGPRLLANLQYLLVAHMLSGSRIAPFDDQAVKAYERDAAVVPFAALARAFAADDVAAFMAVLRKAERALEADAFTARFLGDLKAGVRARAALALVTPYTRVRVDYVAAELGVAPADAEAILISLLLDGRLPPDASLDQPRGVLVLSGTPCAAAAERAPYEAPAPRPGARGSLDDETPAAAAAAAARRGALVYTELDALAGKLRGLLGAVREARVSASAEARGSRAEGRGMHRGLLQHGDYGAFGAERYSRRGGGGAFGEH